MNKILVVATHPDDETLGCGGTLIKHKKNGDQIYWMVVTKMYKENGYSESKITEKNKIIEMVDKKYGFKKSYSLGFPAGNMDSIPLAEIIARICEIIKKVRPNIIYVPFKGDIHSDHRITFEAVASSCKRFRNPFIDKIRVYETISETDQSLDFDSHFKPNLWIDIKNEIKKKIEIMNLYKDEISEHPFPRSSENIKALSVFRGATVNMKNAESFMILRDIE